MIGPAYALRCDADRCRESFIHAPRRRPETTSIAWATTRRHAARAGWRRYRRLDLCPAHAADARTREHIARLPVGLFS